MGTFYNIENIFHGKILVRKDISQGNLVGDKDLHWNGKLSTER